MDIFFASEIWILSGNTESWHGLKFPRMTYTEIWKVSLYQKLKNKIKNYIIRRFEIFLKDVNVIADKSIFFSIHQLSSTRQATNS